MIDLHCHILPGIDDGSRSTSESLVMAKLAFEDGIRTIVATPHTLDGTYFNPLQRIAQGVLFFQEALNENGVELKVCIGADVHLCPGMPDRIKRGDVGTINNTGKYFLLEPPPDHSFRR